MSDVKKTLDQCRKPQGQEGKEIVEKMNKNHYEVTGWGLQMLTLEDDSQVVDLGCGGGKTVQRLAIHTPQGKVFGLDYSEDCVEWANELNHQEVEEGRVVIIRGDVTETPFEEENFDVATAVETVYFWPDMVKAFKEVHRILKKEGQFLIVNEAFPDEGHQEKNKTYEEEGDMVIPTPEELENWLKKAGFKEVTIELEKEKNWLRALAQK
ncbi:class I SAM-dependent methyltransferase [Isachenkonia alkalipeptolytica]|uniref:Class I SAM-dependent methyltransferase n=1 Tax=Isachenkonia alkalipeptolytica TaxID=2565777 RepID=A0AA43XKY9_9CLOT|nr:class I SAM-dependent methyltransferase [Isachenkonia alkalipeptolytica]NBG88622.1 class I SAM-dependent methyltransferase [Isachenkonia alkalipeptolytica]